MSYWSDSFSKSNSFWEEEAVKSLSLNDIFAFCWLQLVKQQTEKIILLIWCKRDFNPRLAHASYMSGVTRKNQETKIWYFESQHKTFLKFNKII